ncbi:ribonuclease J [Candidatus Parcubacteria bacterium]|nr:ribonuclease J [Candidatus Parcubacteria bacterium]
MNDQPRDQQHPPRRPMHSGGHAGNRGSGQQVAHAAGAPQGAHNQPQGIHPERTGSTGGRGGRGGRGRGGMRRPFGGRGRDRQTHPAPDMTPQRDEQITEAHAESRKIPPPGDNIRIIPIGGVEEIGKNMTVFEYKDDIIVVDCGFQFREEETPGIDYILPNTKYLEDRKDKIRAVIITHGHLDHIGAIPFVMPKIGNPPLYSRMLTTVMIQKRQEEFPNNPPFDIRVVEKNERVTFGSLAVSFFAVTHTIPDSMGLIIETPHGNIVHTGDLKVDHDDGVPTKEEEEIYARFKDMKVLALLADSTNTENPGFSMPERVAHKNIEEIVKNVKGRLIIGTFASLLDRIIRIIEIAEKYNKKVVIEGRSMKVNVEIARYLKLFEAKEETFISAEQMEQYPPDRIIAISTGAQADEFAALSRMATKKHKYFKITKFDTILLSSSIVPGNERAVQKLKDNLARQGAKIIHYKVQDVHASGHANRDEMAWIHKKVNPRFFIPIHGYHHMLRVHGEIERSLGMPESNIVIPDNGMIIEITDKGEKIRVLKEKAPSNLVLVDGFSVGDVQEVVMRDRTLLSKDGMFVIIASVNPKTGKLRKSPDIISRGFVYLRESQNLLQDARNIIKKTIEDTTAGQNPPDLDYTKTVIVDNVGRFLFQKTNKRPLVIPVLIGV